MHKLWNQVKLGMNSSSAIYHLGELGGGSGEKLERSIKKTLIVKEDFSVIITQICLLLWPLLVLCLNRKRR